MDRWPNFFLVGAPKCATTSLNYILNTVPEIYMSPNKEPNYFSETTVPINHSLKPIRDKQKYLDLFNGVKNEKIVGEASTHYLADPEAPKLIHEVAPNAQILISIRDPVERIFSGYLMGRKLGNLKQSFWEELQKEINHKADPAKARLRSEDGFYSEYINKFWKIFGHKKVKIVIYEEFSKDPKGVVEEILKFLNINHTFSNFENEKHNKFGVSRGPIARYIRRSNTAHKLAEITLPSSVRKYIRENILEIKQPEKPKIIQSDKEFLINYYKTDVKKVEDMLRKKMPWRNFA